MADGAQGVEDILLFDLSLDREGEQVGVARPHRDGGEGRGHADGALDGGVEVGIIRSQNQKSLLQGPPVGRIVGGHTVADGVVPGGSAGAAEIEVVPVPLVEPAAFEAELLPEILDQALQDAGEHLGDVFALLDPAQPAIELAIERLEIPRRRGRDRVHQIVGGCHAAAVVSPVVPGLLVIGDS